MHVNKYYRHHSRYPANSEPPFHKVTHRNDKSIPGCTLAPREGIYRPGSLDEARRTIDARITAYTNDVNAYVNGDLSKDDIFRAFKAPIFGAYGEELH